MDPPLRSEIRVKMVRAKTEGLSLPLRWCIGSCDTTESTVGQLANPETAQ